MQLGRCGHLGRISQTIKKQVHGMEDLAHQQMPEEQPCQDRQAGPATPYACLNSIGTRPSSAPAFFRHTNVRSSYSQRWSECPGTVSTWLLYLQ